MKKSLEPAWFSYPNKKWNNKKAVVIGGGIAGCQSVWHLLQTGWKVTLIERESILASQASGNPAGIISPKMTAKPSAGEAFYRTCFEYVIQQLAELKECQAELDWHPCGLLQLTHNERELLRWQALKRRKATNEFDDIFIQLLNEKQSNKLSGINVNHSATYFPQAGWVNPKSFCESLVAKTFNNTLHFSKILNTNVLSLQQEDYSWHIIDSYNNHITTSDVVIVCNGKDLHQLIEPYISSENLPSQAVAGQTTVVTANDYSERLQTAIGHEGYLTPTSAKTNQLTFGASFDRDNTYPKLNNEIDHQNQAQLTKYLPELSASFINIDSAHTAVRLTTPDRFPYVGGIPDLSYYRKQYADLHQGNKFKKYPDAKYITGLYVLAGFGSRGLTTSALCAKLLVDTINHGSEKENKLDKTLQYCHPARFFIKKLKQQKWA